MNNTQLLKGEKIYSVTTRSIDGRDVETYSLQYFSLKDARKLAKNIVANSRDNESSHSRITLK